MNQRQQTALAHHCRFAFETATARFSYRDRDGQASVVLTVNSGHE